MVPIFEQGSGRGIGHTFDSFEARFEKLCQNNADQAFAFIFYNFEDHALRTILRDQGAFAKLDRLSGKKLTIFYLNTSGTLIERFNDIFGKAIGLGNVQTPCVAFFRWSKNGFTDVYAVPLENADLVHGFNELYGIFQSYINKAPLPTNRLKYFKWVPAAAKAISLEGIRALFREIFTHLPFHL